MVGVGVRLILERILNRLFERHCLSLGSGAGERLLAQGSASVGQGRLDESRQIPPYMDRGVARFLYLSILPGTQRRTLAT